MKNITVEGKKYLVVEDLGFNHNRGMHAKIIIDTKTNKERVVASYFKKGPWKFSKPLITSFPEFIGQQVKILQKGI